MERILSESDLKIVINRYKSRIDQYGLSFDSLKSGSIEKQVARHKIHASSIKTMNATILDIGCGLGQFYSFLNISKIHCQYTGYDVVQEYIEKCKLDFPEASFFCRNIFDEGIDKTYHNIILSQVLNNRYQTSNNFDVMAETIKLAYEHTSIGVSIDMMSSYVDFKSEELFYYEPEKVFNVAKKICKRVLLRHDYRPFEFCIQLFHDNAPDFVV